MNQRCSILGLIISVLVSTENALTVLNNVLPSKPMNAEQSIVKTKTIFFNNGFAKIDPNIYKYNNVKRLNVFDVLKTNNVDVVSIDTKSVTRFPRQARKLSCDKNINEDISGQHIKLLLDLQSENQKDVYVYYDDYHGKNIEMENNSKPVTETLSEFQKRKRCTTTMVQTLDVKRRQKSQELFSENVENGNKSALRCTNCKFSKSNDNSSELVRNFNLQINDDYLIIILKQLIDKLNKTDKLKSIFYEDIPVQRSNGPAASLEDQMVGTKNVNNSSEEEWILKLEKTRGSQIMDKLESSLENTLMNGKWIKSKVTKNKSNDCSKPTVINDLRSDLNDKNESVLNSDVKPLDMKNPENHVVDTDGSISKNSNRLQMIVNTQENKEVTTDPLSEESVRLFESRRTASPSYLSSTPVKDVYDFITIDGNNEDRDTSKDNFESTAVNNYQPTSISEPNEESTSDLSGALRIKDTDEISKSNVNINDNSPKNNSSEGADFLEIEHGSLENNANNCDCNKKVIKNIFSSKLIKNATEINTETYALPNSRMNSHRRLDRSQKKNGENDNSKNDSGETITLKTDNNMKSSMLKTSQRTTEISHKNNINEPITHNALRKFTLIDNDDQSQNGEYDNRRRNIMKANPAIPDRERFNLASRRKINYDENNINNKVDEKKPFSIPEISTTQKNPRRFVEQSKQPQKTDAYEGNNIGEYANVDRMVTNKRISSIPKNSTQMSDRIIDRNSSRNIPEKSRERTVVHHDDNGSKNNRRIINTKSKHDVPTNRNTQMTSRYGEYDNNNGDDVTRTVCSKSKSLWRVTTKSTADESLPKVTVSRRPGKNRHGNEIINEGHRQLTKGPHAYGSFDSSVRIDKDHGGNHDSENGRYSRKNGEGNTDLDADVKLRKPSSSSRSNTNGDEIQTIPKNTYEYIGDIIYPTDGEDDGEPFVRNALALKRPKPTESANAPKSETLTDTASPTVNDEIVSTLKLKKPSDNGKMVAGPRPLNERYTPTTGSYYHDDLLEKPDRRSSKDQNASNDDRSSAGAGSVAESGRKRDSPPKRVVPSQSKLPEPSATENADRAPRTAEDPRPTAFDVPTGGPVRPGPKHAIREYHPRGSNEDHGKPGGRGTFQVLRGTRAMDGGFNVPPVGRVDRGGPVTDVSVPVRKPDGRRRHSAVSLAELLTGDFRLADGGVTASEPAAPECIVQIINNNDNGLGSRNCSAGAKSIRPNRQIGPARLRNAYGRSGPEFADTFLRAYAPPCTTGRA